MAALAHLLPVLVNVAFVALVFAFGLHARFEDVTALWRQPRLLLRALVAIYVVVPLAAVLLVQLMAPARPVVLGILAMAIAPGAIFAPQKGFQLGGRGSFVYGLLVTVSLLAIVIMPLTLELVHFVFATERETLLTPSQVAREVFIIVLVPLFLGMAIHRALPSLAARLRGPLLVTASMILTVILLLVFAKAWSAMMALGGRAFLLMALVSVVTLTAAHLLGGPQPEDRTALTLASSWRHPGLAMLVTKVEVPGQPVAAAVLASLLVAILVVIPYMAWQKRRLRAEAGESTATPAPAPPVA